MTPLTALDTMLVTTPTPVLWLLLGLLVVSPRWLALAVWLTVVLWCC